MLICYYGRECHPADLRDLQALTLNPASILPDIPQYSWLSLLFPQFRPQSFHSLNSIINYHLLFEINKIACLKLILYLTQKIVGLYKAEANGKINCAIITHYVITFD